MVSELELVEFGGGGVDDFEKRMRAIREEKKKKKKDTRVSLRVTGARPSATYFGTFRDFSAAAKGRLWRDADRRAANRSDGIWLYGL